MRLCDHLAHFAKHFNWLLLHIQIIYKLMGALNEI